MPDLSIEYYWSCDSLRSFSTEVKGTKDTYTVSFFRTRHADLWECSCLGFKFRGQCKHIAEAEKKRCGWHQFIDGGDPVMCDGERKCPKCGGEVFSEGWGV